MEPSRNDIAERMVATDRKRLERIRGAIFLFYFLPNIAILQLSTTLIVKITRALSRRLSVLCTFRVRGDCCKVAAVALGWRMARTERWRNGALMSATRRGGERTATVV